MKMIRSMILLIPLLGLVALFAGIWEGMDPITQAGAAPDLGKIVLLVAVALAIFAFVKKVISLLRAETASEYIKTKVIGARVGDGIGELTVEASHSMEVSRALTLPKGSRIITEQRNHRYRVELPSDRRAVIESIARSNGYLGEVG